MHNFDLTIRNTLQMCLSNDKRTSYDKRSSNDKRFRIILTHQISILIFFHEKIQDRKFSHEN